MEATARPTTTSIAAGMSVAAVAAAVVYTCRPSGLAGDLSYLAGLAAVSVVTWAGVRGQPRGRNVPAMIATGLGVSVAGSVIEVVAEMAGTGAVDWLVALTYFAGYLALGAAVLGLLRPPGGRRRFARADASLEAATVVTVGVLLAWTASTTEAFEASGMSVAEGALQISTPLADLILVVFSIRAIVVYRGRSATSWLLAIAMTLWLLTGVASVVVGATASDRLDVGWLLGMLFLALATLPRGSQERATGAARLAAPQAHATTRMLLAILPAAVPPLAHLITHHNQQALYVPYVGMSVLLLITLVRVGRLLASEEAANAEVARSRRYFQALADNSVDAIVVVDERLAVVFCSRSVERYLGSAPEHDLLSWVGEVGPQVRESLANALSRSLAAPHTVVQDEFELDPAQAAAHLAAHVDHRWVLGRFVNLLDDPAVRGIVISLSDSTARKQAELELARARDAALAGSRAKSTFLATMSHEIRTPLNGVLGLTELMLTTRLDDEQSRYAEGVRVAGEALLQVISDILDFSKIEAGRLDLDEVDFDVVRLLDETAGLVTGAAQQKGLDLLVRRSPEVPRGLRGDSARLRQVLLNLTANAIKFTASGEVVVSVRLDRPLTSDVADVRFEVTDTGIGVDPDQREHLFDAFTQADSSTTRRFGGTGLGLAISRQLVTAMGGEIGVESRSGAGSAFWFTVPLPVALVQPRSVEPPSVRPNPGDPPATGAPRGRVLVVEDSEVNRLVAVGILEHLGYHATVAHDGLEALAALGTASFDAVLMDCLMPGMDGYRATAEIRRQGLGGHALPVIAMTASAVAGDRERCLAAGMNDYITKPATTVEVAAVLARWVPGARSLTSSPQG